MAEIGLEQRARSHRRYNGAAAEVCGEPEHERTAVSHAGERANERTHWAHNSKEPTFRRWWPCLTGRMIMS